MRSSVRSPRRSPTRHGHRTQRRQRRSLLPQPAPVSTTRMAQQPPPGAPATRHRMYRERSSLLAMSASIRSTYGASIADRPAAELGRVERHLVEQPLQHGVQPARADVLGPLVDERRELGDPLDGVGRELERHALGRHQRHVLLDQRALAARSGCARTRRARAPRARRESETGPAAPESGPTASRRGTRRRRRTGCGRCAPCRTSCSPSCLRRSAGCRAARPRGSRPGRARPRGRRSCRSRRRR